MTAIYLILITVLSFVYFLVLNFLEKALKKLKIPENVRLLQNKVSVIVCARNEQHNLPGLFERLENQEMDGLDVEFIIVDVRSVDSTARMIEDKAEKD